MIPALSLWLPVLVSAVAVFIVSSVMHMLLPIHKNDYQRAPDEDGLMDALRDLNLPPGDYMVPKAESMEEMNSDEFREKYSRGPVALVTVAGLENSPMNLARQLVQWFILAAVVSLFVAYLAGLAYGPGAEYMEVFRFVGAAAFMSHGLAHPIRSIWFHQNWAMTMRSLLDALIYGLVTAGVFGWLWP